MQRKKEARQRKKDEVKTASPPIDLKHTKTTHLAEPLRHHRGDSGGRHYVFAFFLPATESCGDRARGSISPHRYRIPPTQICVGSAGAVSGSAVRRFCWLCLHFWRILRL